MSEQETPRVILRRARRGRFDDADILVIEMGLAGSKFEHATRLDVGRTGTFSCGPLITLAAVRHSVALPTPTGLVYQSGVGFTDLGPAEKALLFELLIREANDQVVEWESNLAGEEKAPAKAPAAQSAVVPRFISLRFLPTGWRRSVTSKSDQPADGVTIVDGTPEEEVEMLRGTYEAGDGPTRELLRQIATIAILERLNKG